MRVQLRWVEVDTGLERTPTLETPVAFGREFGSMPSTVEGASISRMVLANDQVEAYHALLTEQSGELLISDRGSRVCTQVNGVALPTQTVLSGDVIKIGPFEITVTVLTADAELSGVTESQAGAVVSSQLPTPTAAAGAAPESVMGLAGVGVNGMGTGTSTTTSAVGDLPADFMGADGRCDRNVGFLFKRRCGRTTTEGCPDCRNGQIDPNRDRYVDDYAYYPNYGYYGHGGWGHSYYHNRHYYYYDPDTRNVDFNESDAASFEQEGDQDYEMDLDAS